MFSLPSFLEPTLRPHYPITIALTESESGGVISRIQESTLNTRPIASPTTLKGCYTEED